MAIRNNAMRLVAVLGVVTLSSAVEARIVCKSGVQRSSGQWIVTPYCQDALLGQVAREHGMRVSDRTLRQNPNRKRHVCRLVGQDIRVRDICRHVNPYDGRHNF